MTTELRFLAASVILGLLHLIVDSHLISFQYGYRWTASTLEQPVPPLRGVAIPPAPAPLVAPPQPPAGKDRLRLLSLGC
jgi:hypothetical protein